MSGKLVQKFVPKASCTKKSKSRGSGGKCAVNPVFQLSMPTFKKSTDFQVIKVILMPSVISDLFWLWLIETKVFPIVNCVLLSL